jgi:hypothetical protein
VASVAAIRIFDCGLTHICLEYRFINNVFHLSVASSRWVCSHNAGLNTQYDTSRVTATVQHTLRERMLAKLYSVALEGIEGIICEVKVDFALMAENWLQ